MMPCAYMRPGPKPRMGLVAVALVALVAVALLSVQLAAEGPRRGQIA